MILQRAKEVAFFISVFLLVVYGLSFLSPDTSSNPPAIGLKDLVAPYLPALLAILKSVLICILTIIIGLATIPFRDWLERQQEKRINKRASKVAQEIRAPIPANDYRQRHQIEVPVAPENVARTQVLSHALHERMALRSGVIALLNNLDNWEGSKERETANAESLIAELKQRIGALEQEARKPVARPSQTALNGPSWRAIAELVSWYKKEPAIGLKASRNAFRAAGIRISDVDLQPGGEFGEWVRSMAEIKPYPIASASPVVEEKPTELSGRTSIQDAGRTDRRAAQRSQPRKRRG